MNIEQLLKSISLKIKANEAFFKSNPELFYAIEQRFIKAAYDDYDDEDSSSPSMWERQMGGFDDPEQLDSDYSDEDGLDAYGDEPEDYNDEDLSENEDMYPEDADQDVADAAQEKAIREWQAQQAAKQTTPQQTAAAISTQPSTEQPQQQKTKSGRPSWKPKTSYAEHHSSMINKFISQGYSHREAERLAGASDDFNHSQIIGMGIKPDEPSEIMLGRLKEAANSWLSDYQQKAGLMSDPSENPINHLNANKNHIMAEAGKDIDKAIEEYRNSISHITDPKQKAKLIIKFKHDFAEKNPHIHQNHIKAADKISQIARENDQLRTQRRQEAEADVVTAGMGGGGEESPFSFQSHDDDSSIQGSQATKEGIAQAVGGVKGDEDEGGTNVKSEVDPALKIKQANPQFVNELSQKIVKRLAPEQLSRLNQIKGIKKDGDK